jgi:hypothetical protein
MVKQESLLAPALDVRETHLKKTVNKKRGGGEHGISEAKRPNNQKEMLKEEDSSKDFGLLKNEEGTELLLKSVGTRSHLSLLFPDMNLFSRSHHGP